MLCDTFNGTQLRRFSNRKTSPCKGANIFALRYIKGILAKVRFDRGLDVGGAASLLLKLNPMQGLSNAAVVLLSVLAVRVMDKGEEIVSIITGSFKHTESIMLLKSLETYIRLEWLIIPRGNCSMEGSFEGDVLFVIICVPFKDAIEVLSCRRRLLNVAVYGILPVVGVLGIKTNELTFTQHNERKRDVARELVS